MNAVKKTVTKRAAVKTIVDPIKAADHATANAAEVVQKTAAKKVAVTKPAATTGTKPGAKVAKRVAAKQVAATNAAVAKAPAKRVAKKTLAGKRLTVAQTAKWEELKRRVEALVADARAAGFELAGELEFKLETK